ncbi:ABC transporter permease [Allofournierella sp.]|uniref:ABC transporter permease n=1 Tax=Allofournierella sp. TaxID=1940256 RepID=UPI003AB57B2B
MKISDLLKLSTDNLRRRKGRTALTVIGVVVGTFAIIVMISLGIASNAANEQMLQSWGDLTQVQINNYQWGASSGDIPTLDDEMLEQIRTFPHVVAVTPMYQSQSLNAQIYAGKNDRYSAYVWNMYGVDMQALEAMEYQLISGSFITDDMNLGKKKIPVLIGEHMAYEFEDTRKSYNSGKRHRYWGETDAMGNPVPPFVDPQKDKMVLRLSAWDKNGNEKTQDFQLVVVGVFQQDDSKQYFTNSGMALRVADMKMLEAAYQKLSGGKSNNGGSYMITSDGQQLKQKDNGYESVYVKVDEVDNVSAVEAAIKELGYETYSMTQIREEMQAQVAKSQMILGGTAAVALLVAALNIANTMMMSIYERTKEIGVMKVLGCEIRKIRNMFLMEAGAIGLLGGVIGVALSYGASYVLNNINTIMAFFGKEGVDLSGIMGGMGSMMGMGGNASISIIPPWLVLLGLGFSTLVGILSGLWPAHRATKISALEAIRHE